MNRYELIDKVVAEIAKEKEISEGEVGTYDTLLRVADIAVKNCSIPDVMCRFLWKGQEFPNLIISEEGYELFETIIPTPSGDYFLAQISSLGDYKLVDTIGAKDVIILNGT